ncbi:MAG: LysR substrate-binding domain-containing protein [Chthoniobacteraceae bacterium]
MNRASIRELECFVAVAEELNFSRAARRLHVSQPPLTRQIQSLEEKLALQLFERSTRAVSLTPAGALYLEDARGILMRLDGATEAARRAVTGESSRLRLAFIGALLDEGLVRLLQVFRESHPQCQIHLSDLSAAAQLEALEAGQVDGAFIGAPPQGLPKDIASVIWKREPLLIALPEGHALAAFKSLSFSALKPESWVMISRNAAPAFRQQFDELCAGADFSPRVVQESDRVAAVLTMVAAGQGISLLPEAMSRLIREGVAFRPVKGVRPELAHTFVYRSRKPDPVVVDFVKLLGVKG